MTVASAYRELRTRGFVVGEGRRGTSVAQRPPLPTAPSAPLPAGALDLASGNPDPELLPRLGPFLARLDPAARLYGEPGKLGDLVAFAAREFRADGIPEGPVAVVGGALDGIERALLAHLRPGDRVVVEDPGFGRVRDLVVALALVPVPVRLDERGPSPSSLARALEQNVRAIVVSPRAQNPTGAAFDAERERELRRILRAHPEVLLVEDDFASPVAGIAARTLAERTTRRWVIVRSVSKALGPDLRVAFLTGDEETVARVEGRQLLGTGWVSHVLQRLAFELLRDGTVRAGLHLATIRYEERRRALLAALAAEGLAAHGRSGLNVWVPVPEEAPVVRSLLERGYAVQAGERFRIASPPAVRVTIARLEPREAPDVARAIADALRPHALTYSA